MRLTKTKIILFLVVLLIGMLCFMPKTYATTYVSGDFKYEVSNNKAKLTYPVGLASYILKILMNMQLADVTLQR